MYSEYARLEIENIKRMLVSKYGKDAMFSDLDEEDQLQLRIFQMQLETATQHAGAHLFVIGAILVGIIVLAVFVLLK